MEIIFASTGVECVAAPSRGVIYLDPTLDQESAIEAIQASMPRVHIDAIRHWVEKAMPSATPLSRRVITPQHKRRYRALGAFACVVSLALGAVGAWGALWYKHTIIDNVFKNPVFSELMTDRDWTCDRSLDHPQRAVCVTPDGVTIHALATQADVVVTYTLSYVRAGAPYMDKLVEWASPEDKPSFIRYEDMKVDGLHPNLERGRTWILYGNDAERIPVWADGLRNPRDI